MCYTNVSYDKQRLWWSNIYRNALSRYWTYQLSWPYKSVNTHARTHSFYSPHICRRGDRLVTQNLRSCKNGKGKWNLYSYCSIISNKIPNTYRHMHAMNLHTFLQTDYGFRVKDFKWESIYWARRQLGWTLTWGFASLSASTTALDVPSSKVSVFCTAARESQNGGSTKI